MYAADAMWQSRGDVHDVAYLDLPALATVDLAVLEDAASRQRPATFEHDPQVRRDRMHQPGFSSRDTADVHVVFAALDHAKRLELLRIHVLQVLGELVLGNGDRMVLWRLLQDDRSALAALSTCPAGRRLHPSALTTRAGGPGLASALRDADRSAPLP